MHLFIYARCLSPRHRLGLKYFIMSEAPLPAWKRAGLKHSNKAVSQAKSAYDPLKEGLKRAGDSDKKPAKPAKKQKVAKADKPAPTHELDQLAYLRQYAEDREAWKFSKQKQNWLLKHLFSDAIGDKYEAPLVAYIAGIQGSARAWVLEDSLGVVGRWNEFMRAEEKDQSEKGQSEKGGENQEESKDGSRGGEKDGEKDEDKETNKASTKEDAAVPADPKSKKKSQDPEPPKVPSQPMVLRAKKLIEALGGECPTIEFLN